MHTTLDLQSALKLMTADLLLAWSAHVSRTYGEDSFTAIEVRYVVATELDRRAAE